MKKTIITTAICFILFEFIIYISIAFTYLKINPNYWSEHTRSGFSFMTICAFVVCGIIIFAFKPEK